MRGRFAEGDQFPIDGVTFRVERGTKNKKCDCPIGEDLVLKWYLPTLGEWVPITMESALVMAEFFYDNEETLFHSSCGYRGGQKFYDAINMAIHRGADKAWAQIEAEKARKEARLFPDEAA